jgi:SpoVK/Ycf46/Vps4 family AAA+-type ATPase
MGKSVGSTEDNLISLFSFARSRTRRCVLILDDIENVCGHEYNGPTGVASENSTSQSAGEPHQLARSRYTLLSALEFLHLRGQGNELLVICTSRYNINDSIDRFDKVYTLTPPDISNRRRVISSNLGLINPFGDESSTFPDVEIESLLSGIVECTIGMSYAELSQYCRQAVEATKVSGGDEHDSVLSSHTKILEGLKQSLQASLPGSLRSGVNDDFVDLTVMTARDLLNMSSGSTPGTLVQLPLLGLGAKNAWEELRRLIVMPLCQAKALDNLLYQQGGSGRKVFCGGVLLTGVPGCGKSAMAYYCASVAASLVPSVKLIDVSCTSLIHKEVGGSERSIHRLFACARAAAPCILLMDGIENIAAVRGNDNTTEGTMDRVLSTLLTELDGVDNENFAQDKAGGIAIIGITHNVNWIDPALRRPGRLEKIIELGPPEVEARVAIILNEIHKTPSIHSGDELKASSHLEDLAQFVAEQTQGMTGAAVIAVCDEAKMKCVRGQLDIPSTDTHLLVLTRNHFVAAIQTQRSGQKA